MTGLVPELRDSLVTGWAAVWGLPSVDPSHPDATSAISRQKTQTAAILRFIVIISQPIKTRKKTYDPADWNLTGDGVDYAGRQ